MKLLHALTAIALLAAALLTAGCIDLADEDDVEIGTINGPYMQGPYMQGPYMQGTDTTGGFGGHLDTSAFFGTLRNSKGARLYKAAIVGSELRAKTSLFPTAKTLSGTQLRGAWWESNGYRFTIKDVRRDAYDNTMVSESNADNADAWEYLITYRKTSELWSRELCMQDAGGEQFATFVPGRWDSSRTFIDDSNAVTLGCSAGTIHKCAFRWGYKRWKSLPRAIGPYIVMTNLAPYHSACVRAASASLCPSGYAHTKDGTMIDMVDSAGFNIKSDQDVFDEINAAYGTAFKETSFEAESWYSASGTVGANYERYMVYTGDSDPNGVTIDIYEPDANGDLSDTPSCQVNRYEEATQGLSPTAPWHIKVYSDQLLWNPPDLGDIEPTGPLEELSP